MLHDWAETGPKMARYQNVCVTRRKIRESSPPLSATKLRPCLVIYLDQNINLVKPHIMTVDDMINQDGILYFPNVLIF